MLELLRLFRPFKTEMTKKNFQYSFLGYFVAENIIVSELQFKTEYKRNLILRTTLAIGFTLTKRDIFY